MGLKSEWMRALLQHTPCSLGQIQFSPCLKQGLLAKTLQNLQLLPGERLLVPLWSSHFTSPAQLLHVWSMPGAAQIPLESVSLVPPQKKGDREILLLPFAHCTLPMDQAESVSYHLHLHTKVLSTQLPSIPVAAYAVPWEIQAAGRVGI